MGKNYFELKNRNCWIVYLMPFGDKSNINEITEFQESCILQNVFGMGWYSDKIEENFIPTDEIINKYLVYQPKAETALNNYKEIKRDDVVIVRNKNAHYYIGRVSEETHYYSEENDVSKDKKLKGKISWMCNVDQWYDLGTDVSVPGDVVGRFSQRFHSTIQQVANRRLKILLIQMLEEQESGGNYSYKQIYLNKDNFTSALNYMDLEDLVYKYILNIHNKDNNDNYILYPSSCKVNRAKFEFALVNKDNKKKIITCQVKNKEKISLKEYENETEFEKIYLFSGSWSDEDADKLKENKKNERIKIIKRSDLFKTLRTESDAIFSEANQKIYSLKDIDDSIKNVKNHIENNGYDKVEKSRYSKNEDKQYKEYDDRLEFKDINNIYFSKEFNLFIVSDIGSNDKEKEFFKSIVGTLSY